MHRLNSSGLLQIKNLKEKPWKHQLGSNVGCGRVGIADDEATILQRLGEWDDSKQRPEIIAEDQRGG